MGEYSTCSALFGQWDAGAVGRLCNPEPEPWPDRVFCAKARKVVVQLHYAYIVPGKYQ